MKVFTFYCSLICRTKITTAVKLSKHAHETSIGAILEAYSSIGNAFVPRAGSLMFKAVTLKTVLPTFRYRCDNSSKGAALPWRNDTRCNTSKRVMSSRTHFRVIAPGNPASFEETSLRWRAIVNTVSDLTGPRFEPQTSRSRDERVNCPILFDLEKRSLTLQ